MESPLFPLTASPRLIMVADAGTYPPYSVVTGTFTTVGTAVTFSADTPRGDSGVRAGDFLYSSSNGQVRRIKTTMGGQNTCLLEEAFSADVSSAENNNIIRKENGYRGISFRVVTGAATVDVDGTAILDTDGVFSYYNPDGLDPIGYSATGSQLLLTITK